MKLNMKGGEMNMNLQKGSTMTTVAIAVFVGLIIAGIGLVFVKNNQTVQNETTATAQSEMTPSTDTKAADLRAILRMLETEHVDLAAAATRNGFDGNADFDASAKALDNNSVALAQAVGSVYGPEAEKQFLEIWRSHITFFVDYTVAAKTGDKAGMNKAVQNLNGYTDAISDFFSKANPNLPREAVYQLVSEHVTLLKSAVDAHGAGNYTESYAQQNAAVKQIGTISDTLAGAIVKQNPESFK